jgi:hypothetical protein
MATAKKTTKKTDSAEDLRVLAFRIPAAAFDALTAACEKQDVSKTQMVTDGLVLILKKLGHETAAKKFATEKEAAS